MSDLTPEELAELRRLLIEAPPLQYRDSPPGSAASEGPTYVALEAQREGRWEEVATGSLALAAAAVKELAHVREARDNARAEVERLTAQVDAVRALHQPCTCSVCGPSCEMCDSMTYPCATIRALDGEADRD